MDPNEQPAPPDTRTWRFHPDGRREIFPTAKAAIDAEKDGWVDSLSKIPGTPEYRKVHGNDGPTPPKGAAGGGVSDKPLNKHTVAELQAILKERGIEFETDANKARLIELIQSTDQAAEA